MMEFLATFHTHLSAMLTCQAMTARGISARMAPVPRKLSSSCGTCVRYRAQEDLRALLDADFEALYRIDSTEYQQLLQND